MRILVIKSGLPYPLHSGTNLLLYNLLAGLCKYHEVSLVSPLRSEDHGGRADHVRALGVLVHTVADPPAKGVLGRYASRALGQARGLLSNTPARAKRATSRAFRRLIQDVMSLKTYDLVQIHHWFLAGVANLVHDTPTVLFSHGVQSDLFSQMSMCEPRRLQKLALARRARLVQRYEDRWFGRFDRIVTVTETDACLLRDRFPELQGRVEALPVLWYDHTGPSDVQKAALRGHSIVVVGDMRHPPNVEAVLHFVHDIMPLVAERVPDITFHVVGRNPRPEIRMLAARPNVEVTGAVRDVTPFVRSARAYVCPMRLRDGIKIKLLEALSLGKAIVAYDSAVCGYAVQSGRELLVAGSAEDFAGKVVQVLTDEPLRRRLGENAVAYVKRCHMGAEVERLIADKYELWAKEPRR